MLEPTEKTKKVHIITTGLLSKDVTISDENGNVIDMVYEFTIHGKVGEVTTCELKLYPEKIDIIAEVKQC